MASAEFEVVTQNGDTSRPRRMLFLLATKSLIDSVHDHRRHDDDGSDRG